MSARWTNYRKANTQFPHVRKKELDVLLKLVNPQKGERIIEVGTGNGYLTFPLAYSVGSTGMITTYDVVRQNLEAVDRKNISIKLPIIVRKQKSHTLDEASQSGNKIVSIATFHHYDNRSRDTGYSGRLHALCEYARVLRKGGCAFLADVAKETATAQYFDAIDDPLYCAPYGHPHDFLNKKDILVLCQKAGFTCRSYATKSVPWKFHSAQEAALFLRTIHNARCSEQKSLDHAKKFLRFWKEGNYFYLEWQLFYCMLIKH